MSHRTVAAFLVAFVFWVCVPRAGAQECVDPQADPRREPFETSENEFDWTIADVLIIGSDHLAQGPTSSTYKMWVLPWIYFNNQWLICDDQDYWYQPAAVAAGSGVLVGTGEVSDRILTQRHLMHAYPGSCAMAELCDNTSFVFGYGNYSVDQWEPICDSTPPFDCYVIVNKSDVYTCAKQWDECQPGEPAGDWAVLQLDRRVAGRHPRPIKGLDTDPPGTGAAMTIIGHPNRIPMKVESVQLQSSGSGYYDVNGHVINGSSGSMVVEDSTGEVIGTVNSPPDPLGLGCEPANPDECYRENYAGASLTYVTAAYLAASHIP